MAFPTFLKGCARVQLHCARRKNILSQNYTVLSSLNYKDSNVLYKLHNVSLPVVCNLYKHKPRSCSNKPADSPTDPKKPDDEADNNFEFTDLMKMPLAAFPNFFYTIKNVILCKFIIQPYFDNEFNIKDFLAGAKQALVYVSSRLASGALNDLQEIISPEALTEIQENYCKLNVKQRYALQVSLDDIFFSFPHQIGIIMDDESKKRYTEITVVYHCLRGIKDLDVENRGALNLEEYQNRITVCNYRFIKEFTKGVQSEWTINRLNHFRAVRIKQ